MRYKRIFGYFFNVGLLLFSSFSLLGQESNNKTELTEELPKEPFFRGLYVGADLFAPAAYLLGTNNISYEASLFADLNNKFFPIWEIGFGKGNALTEYELGMYSKTALYNRIGLNYNMLNNKHKDFVYLGLRYGFSSFDYGFENILITENFWKEEYKNTPAMQSATVHWGEMAAGVQVHITAGLYMGWSIRYKLLFNQKVENEDLKPWYIPGYGTSKWGIGYTVHYKIK